MPDCTLLKFLPDEAACGVAMMKVLNAPYKHRGVRFVPTGGITAANASNYLAQPSVVAIDGSWITAGLKDKDWAGITALARQAVPTRTSAD